MHFQFNTKHCKFNFIHFSKHLSYQFPNPQIEEVRLTSDLHCDDINRSFLKKYLASA